jgi:superoxide dismutase, Fe-Mn family
MIKLMNLPFTPDALSPVINKETIDIHYGKHHATYVNNLNTILADYPEIANMTVSEILKNLSLFPEAKRQAVVNNAGQVYNHDLYWQSLKSPSVPVAMSPKLEAKIIESFESVANFERLFAEAGLTQFGSGWAWLSADMSGNLMIEKTSNADSPYLHGRTPILTMDVWEHAYYLDFQNRRADYIKEFFSLINWVEVSKKYDNI